MITIEQIKKCVIESIPDIDSEKLSVDSDFKDYGIDSLDYFNIIIELQTMTGVEIPEADIDQINSVNDIYKYFQER